jgi:hypothetical protein
MRGIAPLDPHIPGPTSRSIFCCRRYCSYRHRGLRPGTFQHPHRPPRIPALILRSRSAINNCPSYVHVEAYDVRRVPSSRRPHSPHSVWRTSRNIHQAGGHVPSQDSQSLPTCRDCALSWHQERCNNAGIGHSWATICTAPAATVARSTSRAAGARMVPRYRWSSPSWRSFDPAKPWP